MTMMSPESSGKSLLLSPRAMKSYKSSVLSVLPPRLSSILRMEPFALGPPLANKALTRVLKLES